MPKIHRYNVIAALPEKLKPLRELSRNMWWTWDQPSINLFSRVAKMRAPSLRLNPPELINSLSATEIETLEHDSGFLSQLEEVVQRAENYRSTRSWWKQMASEDGIENLKIAYFSLEFGLHETLKIYSGGLGVLAGDHLKASSDLGLPLVGVGLLYYEGYFSQYLNSDGWQQESYPQINPNRLPITALRDENGERLSVSVRIKNEDVKVRAWKVDVGGVPLYLLDTNSSGNSVRARGITARLYGGDHDTRIQQELVLGVGGLRILDSLGIDPDVLHMNEGHSAFIALEQIRRGMKTKALSFKEAHLAASSGTHFTTHTPVPAGNDVFPTETIHGYLEPYAKELRVETEELLKLGRIEEDDREEPFSMTVLALKSSASSNGVSTLHGRVSKQLWHSLWPEMPLDETPITSITNGIHTSTWTSRDMSELFDRYLGPDWQENVDNPETWNAVRQIPDEELWRIRNRNRSLLVQHCRERVRRQSERRGAGPVEVDSAGSILNPDALTIGFARRFASYKRATLLLHDTERLLRLMNDAERPVQFVFSGKAHPADNRGKELIASLVHIQHRPEFNGRFIFLEDYDMGVARHMVHGVDVWLNNPRRPLEACGTSGMKVAANGGLNLSVLDGWWCEAFDGGNGWSIGQGEEYESESYHDEVESRSIYDLLEREVIPTFYERNDNGVPVEWLRMSKHCIRTIAPQFSATRMVADYARFAYRKIGALHRQNLSDSYERVRKASAQIEHMRNHWPKLKILSVEAERVEEVPIGQQVPISVLANLGPFSPEEIAIEVRSGSLDVTDSMHDIRLKPLTQFERTGDNGEYRFEGMVDAERAGTFGLSIRLVPRVNGKPNHCIPGLMTWWK